MPAKLTGRSDATGSRLVVQPIRLAFQQVADQLRELIVQGELPPGARLPSEAELGVQFGVSRSTVREALRMLASQHLITTSRGVGGGSFVTHPDPSAIAEYLHTNLGLMTGTNLVSIQELLEARELLEVPAARLAAEHRTAEQLSDLEKLVPASLVDLPERRMFEINRAFHQAILDAAGNRLLRVMTQPVFTFLQTRLLRNRATPSFWDEVAADHVKIARAIGKGDAKAAGTEMLHHLARLRPTYEQIDLAVQEGVPAPL
jgi:DNA-binding FadR family transcriptional regulator